MARTSYIPNPTFTLPATDAWELTTGGTCAGIASSFSNTDPDSSGRTGILKAKTVNDFQCGVFGLPFARGLGSNAGAWMGWFPWGRTPNKTFTPVDLAAANLSFEFEWYVEQSDWHDLLAVFNPLSRAHTFFEFILRQKGVDPATTEGWIEVEFCTTWYGMFTGYLPCIGVPLPGLTGEGSKLFFIASPGAALGKYIWHRILNLDLTTWFALAAASYGLLFTNMELVGIAVGVESTGMSMTSHFNIADVYSDPDASSSFCLPATGTYPVEVGGAGGRFVYPI